MSCCSLLGRAAVATRANEWRGEGGGQAMLCLGGNRAPADTLEKGFAPQPIAAGMEPEELGRRWLKRAVPGQDMLFKKVQSRCELCLSEGLAFQHGLSFIVARMETNTADLFSA
eukprot:scaffold75286_cov17-Tisochrysis_lutea.AAC.1